MIIVYLRDKEREARLAEFLQSEVRGRIYTNFAIKGKTLKARSGPQKGLFKMVHADADIQLNDPEVRG